MSGSAPAQRCSSSAPPTLLAPLGRARPPPDTAPERAPLSRGGGKGCGNVDLWWKDGDVSLGL